MASVLFINKFAKVNLQVKSILNTFFEKLFRAIPSSMHGIIITLINPKSFCKICCQIFSFYLWLLIITISELFSYVNILNQMKESSILRVLKIVNIYCVCLKSRALRGCLSSSSFIHQFFGITGNSEQKTILRTGQLMQFSCLLLQKEIFLVYFL